MFSTKTGSLHLDVQQIFNFNNVQDNQGGEKNDEANPQFLIPISGIYGMCKYLDILIPNKIIVPFFVFFCLTYASGSEHIFMLF